MGSGVIQSRGKGVGPGPARAPWLTLESGPSSLPGQDGASAGGGGAAGLQSEAPLSLGVRVHPGGRPPCWLCSPNSSAHTAAPQDWHRKPVQGLSRPRHSTEMGTPRGSPPGPAQSPQACSPDLTQDGPQGAPPCTPGLGPSSGRCSLLLFSRQPLLGCGRLCKWFL